MSGRKNTEQDSNTQFDTNCIAPYSEYNLMSTNIWSDQDYDLICENSLTLLEKTVITPLHVSVTVLRLKTNDIPFSAYGVICYPLQRNSEAKNLPRYEMEDLSFVIVTLRNKFGKAHEGTTDMENIRKTKDL